MGLWIYYRNPDAEWGFFSGKMNKNYEKNHINRILSDSNPEINEKLEILSKEKENDEIDIDLDIEKSNILFIIIIIIIINISIIVIVICIKGKISKKDEYELYN